MNFWPFCASHSAVSSTDMTTPAKAFRFGREEGWGAATTHLEILTSVLSVASLALSSYAVRRPTNRKRVDLSLRWNASRAALVWATVAFPARPFVLHLSSGRRDRRRDVVSA